MRCEAVTSAPDACGNFLVRKSPGVKFRCGNLPDAQRREPGVGCNLLLKSGARRPSLSRHLSSSGTFTDPLSCEETAMKNSSPRALVLPGCVSVCVLWDSAPRDRTHRTDTRSQPSRVYLSPSSVAVANVVPGHDIKHGASRGFLGFSQLHRRFTSIA
jgi:hypothetical protein